jgi:hypothetical protein
LRLYNAGTTIHKQHNKTDGPPAQQQDTHHREAAVKHRFGPLQGRIFFRPCNGPDVIVNAQFTGKRIFAETNSQQSKIPQL